MNLLSRRSGASSAALRIQVLISSDLIVSRHGSLGPESLGIATYLGPVEVLILVDSHTSLDHLLRLSVKTSDLHLSFLNTAYYGFLMSTHVHDGSLISM